MTRDATLRDRLAIWRSRKAESAPHLHPLPPLPLTGDPDRAEAMIAADFLPDGADFAWLNDLAALGDERAGRFAARKIAEWVAQDRPDWTAGTTGWRLLHWLAHARFLYPRGVPAETVAVIARQTAFLHRRWQGASGWDRIAALAGLSAGAHALERPALRPSVLALPPLPSGPDDLLRALVLLLSLRATWDDSALTPVMTQAVGALRTMRHADGRLTGLRGGAGGDPVRLDAALGAAGLRTPPAAQAMGLARLAHGRSTVIADLSRPALAFELTCGRVPLVVATPAGRAEPEVDSRPPRPVPVTDATLTPSALSARHDGWLNRRLIHTRQLTLSPDGRSLTGSDLFDTRRRVRQPLRIDLHFPLHPGISAKAEQGHIALILPNGDAWIFTGTGAILAPHAHGIAISAAIDRFPARLDWTFSKSDATPLTIRDLPPGA